MHPQILRVQAPQCVAKFSSLPRGRPSKQVWCRLFPLAPKLFTLHAKLCANVCIFSSHIFVRGLPKVLDLAFKDPPISNHVAKFRGDRSRKLGDFATKFRKKEIALKFLEGGFPKFRDVHRLSAHTSNHAWKFHGNRPKHLGDMALQNARNKKETSAVKHKTAGKHR